MFDFIPYPFQKRIIKEFFKKDGKRFFVNIFHRRAGKDLTAFYIAISCMILYRNFLVHYCVPNFSDGMDICLQGKLEPDENGDAYAFLDLIPDIIKYKPNFSKGTLSFPNGSLLRIISCDKKSKGKGSSRVGATPSLVIFSEFAVYDTDDLKRHYEPIFTKNPRSKFIICSTPRGRNHLYEEYLSSNLDGYLITKITWKDSGLIEEHQTKNIISKYGKAFFDQEFNCEFTSLSSGLFFYDYLIESLIKRGKLYNKRRFSEKCVVAFDIGVFSLSVATFWMISSETNESLCIDCISDTNKSASDWRMILNEWEELNFEISSIILPHDALKRDASYFDTWSDTMEISYKVNNLSQGGSGSIMKGVDICQMFLKDGKICFKDNENCNNLVRNLRTYKKTENSLGKITGIYNSNTCHFADSFRYFGVYFYEEFFEVSKNASEFINYANSLYI